MITDVDFEPAVRRPSYKELGEARLKDQGASASSAEYVKPQRPSHYSFGKRENIISGCEPKLPKSLLEGRFSERIMQLKGRGYNEEDWFDDSKAEKKIEQ